MLNSSKILENAHTQNAYYSSKFELKLIDISADILIQNLQGNSVLELGCGLGLITKKMI